MNLHLMTAQRRNSQRQAFIKQAMATCPACGGSGYTYQNGQESYCVCQNKRTSQASCATCASGRPCAAHGTNFNRPAAKSAAKCYACTTGKLCAEHPAAPIGGDDYDPFVPADVMPVEAIY